MHRFTTLTQQFETYFQQFQFPENPARLYDASNYMLSLGGKRIRPTLVLMGNELFGDIHEDAYKAAMAVELFHNFSLIHDDIMDKAPLRRGKTTVHMKYGDNTAILSGDALLVYAYQQLSQMQTPHLQDILQVFNKTAIEVCEGQQWDMDFEMQEEVSLEEYTHMIALKTSVLLAGSLKMGAIIGGAGLGNQNHLYDFGKMLGIAFQIQDDYLDVFGDPNKVGKQPGGDILANKKTFLWIHANQNASSSDKQLLYDLMHDNNVVPDDKVKHVTDIFRRAGADVWAKSLKEKYYQQALEQLDAIAVVSSRKKDLQDLAAFLLEREY